MIVAQLNQQIMATGAQHFAVYGRSKHIHSIYKKMQRKNVSLDEIYDATAVRVLVDTVPQCYEVLGMVHNLWEQIPAEFDDYIINPKPNGYQSLHTAVIGPEGRAFEVQIRTFLMHIPLKWALQRIGSIKKVACNKKKVMSAKLSGYVMYWHGIKKWQQTKVLRKISPLNFLKIGSMCSLLVGMYNIYRMELLP